MSDQNTILLDILTDETKIFILSADFISYYVRNFQINATTKLTTKCLLTLSHYKRSHLEHGGQVYVKNKLGSQISRIVDKFMFVL